MKHTRTLPTTLGLLTLACLAGPDAASVATQITPTSFTSVCLITTAGSVDATAEAGNAFALDVPVGATLTGGTHIAYFGLNKTFGEITADVGQAGIDGAMMWFYFDGLGWRELAVAGDANLTQTGLRYLTFTPPADWTSAGSECGARAFYVRGVTAFAYTQIPILDQAWAGHHVPVSGGGGGGGGGSTQRRVMM